MIESLQRESNLTFPSDREIVMKRMFHAPAPILFDVWTKPEHVRNVDLRVGGAWRWVVAKPGLEVAFSGVFREIDPPRWLQRTEVFEAIPGSESLVTLMFDEEDGHTTITMHMLFQNKQHRDA